MPQPISFHRAVATDDTVALVCGGVGESGKPQHTCDTYNATVDKWTSLHYAMHDGRYAHGMTVYKGGGGLEDMSGTVRVFM
jgi:hypothetical protein